MDCFKGCGYILNVRSYGKLFTAAAFPISNRVFLVGGHARISKCVFFLLARLIVDYHLIFQVFKHSQLCIALL